MMDTETTGSEVQIGPFSYRLRTEGSRILGPDEAHLARGAGSWKARARRDCTFVPSFDNDEALGLEPGGALPKVLTDLLPSGAPPCGWEMGLEPIRQITYWHPAYPHCLTAVQPALDAAWEVETRTARFRLPWYALFRDILAIGGAITHGGLADLEGRGYVFLGAPGSGKSTAVSRLTEPWRVLGDDAALVWPEGSRWYASPLPTWSYMLGEAPSRPDLVPWRTGERVALQRLLFLQQGKNDVIRPLSPADATPLLYQAFTEFPAITALRHPFRRSLFAFAAALARAVPASTLELTLDGDYWRLLEDERTDDREGIGA